MTIYGPQLSAGMSTQGNTAGTTGLAHDQLLIVGGANITLSQSFNANSGTMTIIGGAGAAGNTGYLSAGSTYGSLGTMLFSNANGVSFGVNGQTMTASVSPAAGDGVNIISAGTQSANTTGTVVFSNSNNVSFGMTNNSIVTASASYSQSTAPGALAAGTQTGTSGTMLFSDANGITFGMSGSTRITASHNALTSQSNQAVSFTSGSVAFQTLSFTNSNGISFNSGTQGIFASHNALTTAALSNHSHGNPTLALTNLSGTTASASNGLTLSLSAAAPGAGGGIAAAAGTQTATSGTVLFNNANGITFGMSNSSVITASHNGLTTAAASDHSHGNPTLALTNLSGTTASASNGLTLSLSAAAPGGGSPITQKMAGTPYQSVGVHGNAFLSIQPIYIDGYMTATHVKFFGSLSGNTNSSGAISMSFGLYTANGSTMSLASSQSGIIQWTSGTNSTATSATQFGIFNSARMRGLTLSSWGISPGNYMALMWLRTTNNGTLSVGFDRAQTALSLVQVQFTSEYANMNLPRVYTVSATTAMPASIAFSDTAYNLSGSGNKQIAFSIHHSVP